VTTPTHPEPVSNDPIIRELTILSQLTVFRDIIPGYRIRPLTEIEKAEKVSQMVARTRDWEQGLVSVYQKYLRLLEAEFKGMHSLSGIHGSVDTILSGKGDFADVAMHCMCTLLTEITHFNFRVNLMTCIVSRLSKRSWDKVCICQPMSVSPLMTFIRLRNSVRKV
jgi:nucleolar complex protein 3